MSFGPLVCGANQHHDIVAHSVLNDGAHVAQTAALVIGNNNEALCSFARLLQAYRLLGVGAEILWHPGQGANYGMLQLCGIVSYVKPETTSGM